MKAPTIALTIPAWRAILLRTTSRAALACYGTHKWDEPVQRLHADLRARMAESREREAKVAMRIAAKARRVVANAA